jgi:hypothetical protein
MDIFESIHPLIHISLQLYPLIPTSRGFPRPWLNSYDKAHPRTVKRSFTLMFSCLLWIKKVRAKDKTYEWGSVRWEIYECDGRVHDPDTMVVPLTPKPTRKTGALVRVTTTITFFREEDTVMRKWPLLRYCYATCILETKTKVGSTTEKVPDLQSSKYRWDTHGTQITHPPITRMRWANARPRGDDLPTDTQVDMERPRSRQGAADHCLTSWRRHCVEEVAIVTVLLCELHSWN